MPDPKDLNPENYGKEEDAEGLDDYGDKEPEEGEDEDEQPEGKKPAKKAAKKAAKKPAEKDPEDEEDEEDPEDEEDEEEPEDEDDEEGEDKDDKKKSTTVPLSALKKQQRIARQNQDRARQAEERLRQLEGSASDKQKADMQKTAEKLEGLYESVEDLRAEGKTKEAAKVQREIDDIRDGMTRNQAAYLATKQAVQQHNLMAFNSLVKELEYVDSRFDEDSEDFDEELVESVSETAEAFEAKGMSAPDALRKAARIVLGEDPFRKGAKLARDAKSKPAEKDKKSEKRIKTDVQKNLDAMKKQPPEEKSKNKEKAIDLDVSKLSDEDWEKLPASKKAELRGDNG